jgi:hypothetical protein
LGNLSKGDVKEKEGSGEKGEKEGKGKGKKGDKPCSGKFFTADIRCCDLVSQTACYACFS